MKTKFVLLAAVAVVIGTYSIVRAYTDPRSGVGISSIVANAPLTGLGTSGSHLILPRASAIADGYLSAHDFADFDAASLGGVGADGYVLTAGDTMTGRLTSTYNSGAPFAVTSTTMNTNLNADLFDGHQSTDFLRLSTGGIVTAPITVTAQISSTWPTGSPPFVVSSTTVNTSLNADLLDGSHGSVFARLDGSSMSGSLTVNGTVKLTAMPYYANQAAAASAGLTTGRTYRCNIMHSAVDAGTDGLCIVP